MSDDIRCVIKEKTAENLREAALELRIIYRHFFWAFQPWADQRLKRKLDQIRVVADNLEIMADCFNFGDETNESDRQKNTG